MTDVNIDSVLKEIKKESIYRNGELRRWGGEARDKIAPYLYKAHVENHYTFDKISNMCGGYTNWWSRTIVNEYIKKHPEVQVNGPHKMPFMSKNKNVCNWTAEELLDYFLDSNETLVKISEDLKMNKNWAAQKLNAYFKNNPERKEEFEAHKKEIIHMSHTRKRSSKVNKEDDKITKVEEEKDIEDNVIESENVKAEEKPHCCRIFDSGVTLEVDLYNGQKHSFGTKCIFSNRLEASNNLAVAAIDVENFIKNNVRFSDDGVTDVDIILYISSVNDYRLAIPVVNVCDEMGIGLSICEYDDNRKRYNNAYASKGNTINKKMFDMFPNTNRVETLGYSLDDLKRFDELYEVKETIKNYCGRDRYVYKLISPDYDNIIRAFSNMLPNIVLDPENMIDAIVCECKFDDGVLVESDEHEQSFSNYN